MTSSATPPAHSAPACLLPPGTFALVLDGWPIGARLMGRALHRLAPASVEIAADYDEALDIIGIAGRPIHLLLARLDATCDDAARVLAVLRQHAAPIHVHLYGGWQPGEVAQAQRYVGAAGVSLAPFHLNDTMPMLADRMAQGLTVARILAGQRAPEALSRMESMALYARPPGRRLDPPDLT